MRARLFDHDFNLSLALFTMAFQVKHYVSREANSQEIFIGGSSTAFSYQHVDAYAVDASSMALYDQGIIDDKLTEIFASACLKKLTIEMEKNSSGANLIFMPENEFLIRDIDKVCFDPNRAVTNYISDDPRLTSRIFELLKNAYTAGFPENFPELHYSTENGKSQLRVTGTKDQLIVFTNALIAISNNNEITFVVDAEKKSGCGF